MDSSDNRQKDEHLVVRHLKHTCVPVVSPAYAFKQVLDEHMSWDREQVREVRKNLKYLWWLTGAAFVASVVALGVLIIERIE